MLGWRLFLSAIIVPSLVGLMVWDARLGAAAPVLFVLCWLIGLRASWELLALVKQRTGDPRFLPVAVCVTILMLATWAPHWLLVINSSHPAWNALPSLAQVFAGCVLLLFIVRVFRFREPGGQVEGLACELLAVTYVGLLLSVTAHLRWFGPAGNGYLSLGTLVISTKMGDIGAYTLGRLFGRRTRDNYRQSV